jgi:hypothetical protein
VACIGDLSFADDRVTVRDHSLQLVAERSERRKEAFDSSPDFGVPMDRWRGAETEFSIAGDKTEKTLRVHRVDGHEELSEINAPVGAARHC